LDPDKISKVLNEFFTSLKSPEDTTLETGLSQHTTIDILHQACVEAQKKNPEKFERYVKFFLNASMFLLDEDSELLPIE
jgi:hypothetical protein